MYLFLFNAPFSTGLRLSKSRGDSTFLQFSFRLIKRRARNFWAPVTWIVRGPDWFISCFNNIWRSQAVRYQGTFLRLFFHLIRNTAESHVYFCARWYNVFLNTSECSSNFRFNWGRSSVLKRNIGHRNLSFIEIALNKILKISLKRPISGWNCKSF